MSNQKEFIKNKLPEYLTKYHNISNPYKHFTCLNPDHADNDPSMIINKKDPSFCHCFGCNTNYDIFNIIGIDYNLSDYNEQYKKACELFNLDYSEQPAIRQKEKMVNQDPIENDYSEYIRTAAAQLDKALPYLLSRGISEETARRFNIGYDPCFTEHLQKDKARKIKEYYQTTETAANNEAVIIPNDSKSVNARLLNNAIRYVKAGNGIFNLEAIDQDEITFITEGCFDALSLLELGYSAIALNGVNNTGLLLKHLQGLKKERYNPFIIALDNDEAGKNAAIELQKQLNEMDIFNYLKADLTGSYKDPNEYLIYDKAAFANSLKEYTETIKSGLLATYQNNKSTLAYINDFVALINKTETPYIKTGFQELDNELDGGLYEGLYVIGAVSSLGKTTYCLQIADQIAEQGQDVIIFSLEMSRNELIAKSISRKTAAYCLTDREPMREYASTTRTITTREKRQQCNDKQKEYIKNAIAEYPFTARHTYIYEATGFIDVNDIREAIREHINITKNKPVVLIDYLQIIQPLKTVHYNMTDKQQIDFNITELKRISREFKIPILAISSFNRMSYNCPVDLQSFKESGAIEYASDVLIGLQFKDQTEETDQKEEKRKITRSIEAVILKNRNGRTGGKLQYSYYTPFNLFTEGKY